MYVKPGSMIFKDLAAPISVVVGISLVPVPEVVVTLVVGKSVYPPFAFTKTFCIEPDSVELALIFLNVSNSKTSWSVGVE